MAMSGLAWYAVFFFQAEDGIRDYKVTGVQTCALPISKLLSAIGRRMKKEGLGDVKLVVAEQALLPNNYIGPILQDEELMKQVGAFAFHTYGTDAVGPQVERVRQSKFPNVPVWLTEYGDLNDLDRSAEN